MKDYIQVRCKWVADIHRIDITYSPSPNAWKFKTKSFEELNTELQKIVGHFICEPYEPELLNKIEMFIYNKLRQWINNGWLWIDPFYGMGNEQL